MTLYLGENLIAGSFKAGASWEVGDVGISAFGIDEALNKRRYLNGQVISQAQFVQFTAMLKSRVSVYPSLATTEVNWQAEVTNSKLGQCGQFVIDDVAGTIRLPKVVNINGLQDLTGLGEIKAESLPNITGFTGYGDQPSFESGAFTTGTSGTGTLFNGTTTGPRAYFDASLSSSTYQDDAPVQQEAVQYPYFIQVAEGVENSVDVSREIELNNPFSLLDYKYSEYELDNASWLLSNGQYNSGVTYADVYNLLLQIYNGTETKAGVSVKLSTEAYADTDFVLNTNDTTFRFPIKVLMAGSKRVAGNGMTLGLTDGTNYAGLMEHSTAGLVSSVASNYGQAVGTTSAQSTSGALTNEKLVGITTDPTKSGIETSANGLYLYFYVGETVQDANIIAAAGVLTDMANIKNGVGYSSLGKETVVSWGMPDYSAGISQVEDVQYTASNSGILYINAQDYNTDSYITIDGIRMLIQHIGSNQASNSLATYLIGKGSKYTVEFGRVFTGQYITFYPCKGV